MTYIQELLKDTQKAYQEYSANNSAYTRRNYIKNLVVLLEADVYREKLILSKRLQSLLGDDQIVYAIHPDYIDFTDAGLPKFKTEDIPLTKSVKIIFRAYECFVDKELIDFAKDPGWQSFTDLKKLRNRLIHPKTKEDLEITDIEIENARKAETWYLEKLRCLLEEFLDKDNGKLNRDTVEKFRERYLPNQGINTDARR